VLILDRDGSFGVLAQKAFAERAPAILTTIVDANTDLAQSPPAQALVLSDVDAFEAPSRLTAWMKSFGGARLIVGESEADVFWSADFEQATDIAKAHEWQNLTEFHTITANGTDSAYPFPTDYDRMVQASEFYDPNNWAWGYCHITDYGEWLQMLNRGIGMLTPGAWTIRKNQFHFLPTPASGQEAVFPYISKNIFTDTDGAPKN
ncbi:MAG TPA: hypothetical protein PLM89_12740, partial [Anaerolineales bacterium]|nr:hypothetical protein [Anaerolineales bacterium]